MRGGIAMGNAVFDAQAVLGTALNKSYEIESSGKVSGGGIGVDESVLKFLTDWATTSKYSTDQYKTSLNKWMIRTSNQPKPGAFESNSTSSHMIHLNYFSPEVLEILTPENFDEIFSSLAKGVRISRGHKKVYDKWIWAAALLYYSAKDDPISQKFSAFSEQEIADIATVALGIEPYKFS